MSFSKGFTLLEMVVVLALIAIISTLGLRSFRPPSPSLQLNEMFSEFLLVASTMRSRAIHLCISQTVTLEHAEIDLSDCQDAPVPPILFFADGTATPTVICAELSGEILQFQIDGLTGRLVRP